MEEDAQVITAVAEPNPMSRVKEVLSKATFVVLFILSAIRLVIYFLPQALKLKQYVLPGWFFFTAGLYISIVTTILALRLSKSHRFSVVFIAFHVAVFTTFSSAHYEMEGLQELAIGHLITCSLAVASIAAAEYYQINKSLVAQYIKVAIVSFLVHVGLWLSMFFPTQDLPFRAFAFHGTFVASLAFFAKLIDERICGNSSGDSEVLTEAVTAIQE